MRMVSVLLLLSTVSAFAQLGSPGNYGPTPQLTWTFGVQRVQPSLTASVVGSKDGKASSVDTDADLGLAREGTPLGFFAEYQGQTQAFLISYDSARYGGNRILPRAIALDGVSYDAGTGLQTSAKVQVMEGLWTYKFVRRDDAWIGFDLGAQLMRADLSALAPSSPQAQKASPSWLIPQVGLTALSSGAGGLLESRVYVRYFTHKGASLTRYGIDARAYLYPSFGLRAFFEDSRMHIPRGSLQQDLDIRVDRRVTGLGLVVRF
jgi:hypothetical protein